MSRRRPRGGSQGCARPTHRSVAGSSAASAAPLLSVARPGVHARGQVAHAPHRGLHHAPRRACGTGAKWTKMARTALPRPRGGCQHPGGGPRRPPAAPRARGPRGVTRPRSCPRAAGRALTEPADAGAGAGRPSVEPGAVPPAAWTAPTCLRALNGAAARPAPGFISRAPASDLAARARGHVTRRTNGSRARPAEREGARWGGGAFRFSLAEPPTLSLRPAPRCLSPPAATASEVRCCPARAGLARRTVPSPHQGARRANTTFPFPKVKDMGGTSMGFKRLLHSCLSFSLLLCPCFL